MQLLLALPLLAVAAPCDFRIALWRLRLQDSPPLTRALPSPFSSPPFPFADFIGPVIGAPDSTPLGPLERGLRGSDIGEFLSDARLRVYGWTNPSFNLSSSNRSNFPNAYDVVPNSVQLNQTILRVERPLDTVQEEHADWGFRISGLYGIDYRYTVAQGWLDEELLSRNELYGADVPEIFAQLYVPRVAEGLVLKAGRFISPPDIEAQFSPDNYLFTHSVMYSVDPYTFTGIQASLRLSRHWTLQGGVHAGNDMAPWTNSAQPNGQLLVRWVSADNCDSIYGGINSLGSGEFKNGHDNLQHLVATWTHKFSESVHTSTEAYFMWQYDAARGGTVNSGPVQRFGGGGGPGPIIRGRSDALGVVNYLAVSVSPIDYFTVRNDFLEDARGQRTGYKTEFSSHTVGWCHRFTDWAQIRTELRYEHSYDIPAYDNGTKSDQLKLAIDFILRF